jgi:hypothetical protein
VAAATECRHPAGAQFEFLHILSDGVTPVASGVWRRCGGLAEQRNPIPVAISLRPFTPCSIPRSLVKPPPLCNRPSALLLLKKPLALSPRPPKAGWAADSLATGVSPWTKNTKSDLEPPQGGATFTIKESVMEQTWPGQSEKYVTLFVNGSTYFHVPIKGRTAGPVSDNLPTG